MYYIGYTSVISGGDSDVVFDYVKWNYGADGSDTDVVDYPLGYFFSGDSDDERYILKVPEEQTYRQLSAQYPTQEVMDRSAIMQYFDAEETTRINQMWINVRCYNIKNVPVWVWVLAGIIVVALIALSVKLKINKKYD